MFLLVLKVEMNVYYTPPTDFNFPSPPYYRPATSVTISCTTTEAIGQVRYKWSSTAINNFANISSSTNRISTNILKSSDAGIHTCTLYDGAGNTGNQSTTIKLIGILQLILCCFILAGFVSFNRQWTLC